MKLKLQKLFTLKYILLQFELANFQIPFNLSCYVCSSVQLIQQQTKNELMSVTIIQRYRFNLVFMRI